MEKPKRLLLSPHGIKALLAGLKWQHRFIPRQPVHFNKVADMSEDERAALIGLAERLSECRYRKGDQVWIPESYAMVPRTAYAHDPTIPHVETGDYWYIYREGWDRSQSGITWKAATTMPVHAARLWLRITDVVIHPVWEITREEAKREGIKERCMGFINYLRNGHFFSNGQQYTYNDQTFPAEIMSYISLFEHINGLDSWDHNPGVVALTWEHIAGGIGKPCIL